MAAGAAPPSARAVLGELRRSRARRHPGRHRDLAYRCYATVITLTLVGVPLGVTGRRVLSGSLAFHLAAPTVAPALGFGLAGVLLLVSLGALRYSTWQGPVVLSAAMVTWVASLPLSRRALLGGRLVGALLAATGLGVLLAGACTLGLAAFTRASPTDLLAGALEGVPLLCILLTALGVPVERASRLGRAVLTSTPIVATLGLACFAASGAVLSGHLLPAWLSTLVLWSGPWGWAAQPMAAAAGVGAPLWPVAVGLLAAATAGAVATGARVVGSIPTRELRVRAGAFGGARSGLGLHDLRAVHVAAAAARPARRRRARSLPVRGRRVGLVVWRDAVGLVRAPARVASAALFVALALVAVVAGPLRGGPSGLVVLAVLSAYWSATRLVEAARLEADEPGLANRLVMDPRAVALSHVVVASLALFVLGAAGAGIAGLVQVVAGSQLVALVGASAVTWPLLVLGALIAAHKGPVPYATAMLAGQEFGVVVLMAWAVAGPLFVLLALSPAVVSVLRHDAAPGSVLVPQLYVAVLAFLLGTVWLRRRVQRAGDQAEA